MGVEIERKFLVPEPPDWLVRCPSRRIEQGYLAIGDEEEVRVRRIDGQALLTVKRGAGEKRLEVEIEITTDQSEELWPLTEGRRIEKRRHVVDDDRTIEVDVYEGSLEGLVVAEVEFESEDEAGEFDPPGWVGEELTGDPRYANETLAVDGLPSDGD